MVTRARARARVRERESEGGRRGGGKHGGNLGDQEYNPLLLNKCSNVFRYSIVYIYGKGYRFTGGSASGETKFQ
jgi:hypothetical protein